MLSYFQEECLCTCFCWMIWLAFLSYLKFFCRLVGQLQYPLVSRKHSCKMFCGKRYFILLASGPMLGISHIVLAANYLSLCIFQNSYGDGWMLASSEKLFDPSHHLIKYRFQILWFMIKIRFGNQIFPLNIKTLEDFL